MPRWGGGEQCVRCGGSCYPAESKTLNGKHWHKHCFNCQTCRKALDTKGLVPHEGDIYCKGCYKKQGNVQGADI